MAWTAERVTEIKRGRNPDAQRLDDLALAMVIPWKDGFPQYWLDEKNEQQRMREILDATENLRLPWEH